MTKYKIGALCAALLASVLMAGCGKRAVPASEPMVLEVYDSLSDYEGMQQGWYASALREKFNIELRFMTREEKKERNLLEPLQEEELPDLIFYSGEEGDLEKMVEAGNLFEMEALLEGTEIAEYKDALKALNEPAAEDGIYAVPGQVSRLSPETPSEALVPEYGVYLRWDIYSEAGYPEIKDMEELLDVMEQMQELVKKSGGKDVYALSFFNEGGDSALSLVSQIAGLFGYGRRGFVFAEAENRKYHDVQEEDSWYGEACEWLREAYERGLIDPDSFTQTREEADKKYRDGKALITFYPETGTKYSSSSGALAEGQGMELAPMKGMKVLSRGCNSLGRQDQFLALGRNVKDPDRVMAFLNWFYSPEGIMVSGTGNGGGTAGIQGLTWDMEEGNPALTEYGQKVFGGEDQEVPEEFGGGMWQEGICRLGFFPVTEVEVSPSGFPYFYQLWDTVEEEDNSPLKQDWKDFMEADDAIEYLMKGKQLKVIPGGLRYSEEEPRQIADARADCLQILQEDFSGLLKAATEEEFDILYQDMNSRMKEAGYDDVLQYDFKLLERQKEFRQKSLL